MDLVQDTFMRFWGQLSKGVEVVNDRALLFSIARNLVIDWYRKKKSISLEALEESGEGNPMREADDGAAREIEMNAEARYLLEKIRELEDTYQEVVYLRFVEGLKPKEIGEMLGESANTVSVRITRGIQALRDLTGYNIEKI